MGTSDAYSGSGGRAWGDARRAVDGLTGGSRAEALIDLLAAVARATPWKTDTADGDDDGGDESAVQAPPNDATPPPRVELPPMLRVPVRRGGGGLGGAGGGLAGGERRGGSGDKGGGLGGRSGRSRRTAARVGARAVGAGVAYANRNGAALAALGLDLAELDRLDPIERCQRMMDLFDGAATIADGERRRAAANTLVTLLEAAGPVTAEAGVRLFCAEYIFQVLTSEVGRELRSEPGSGARSKALEDDIRSFINAVISTTPLPVDDLDGSVPVDRLERVIGETLGEARAIFIRRQR